MSKALQRITPWIVGTVLAVSLSACGSPSEEQPPTPDPIAPAATEQQSTPPEAVDPADPSTDPMDPADQSEIPSSEPLEDPGTEVTFDGEGVTTDTITANMMEMVIPSGIRIPEDTLVTEALDASIMMADEDPAAVIAMVESSAADAGYEMYAETTRGKVYVGNGNAVLFEAGPRVQILTWGPEAMKDVLAQL